MGAEESDNVMLEAMNVRAGYASGQDVLRGCNLAVREGEFVTLIGPNGAGKSTFLKSLFGLVRPREGSVHFKGDDVTAKPPLARVRSGVSFCAQGRCNFGDMSVRDNLLVGGITLGTSLRKEALERVSEVFPRLRDRMNQKAGTMSGGEQQLLEMGMALMTSPRLLLIDEPTLGLDPKNVAGVFSTIGDLRRHGLTVVMVEQNAVQALSVSDRGVVMEQGVTRMEGEAGEILEDPSVRELYLGGMEMKEEWS